MERIWKGIMLFILFSVFTQVSWSLAQGKDEILAKVGNEVITRIDFETRIKNLPPEAQQELKDPEKRKEVLEKMIKARLFFAEGMNRGLTEREDIKAHLRMVRDDYIIQEYGRVYLAGMLEITNEEVEKAYYTDPEIREREYLKVSQIVVQKEEEGKEILERLKKGELFKKLAFEKSIDTKSKQLGGELEWFEKGKQEKEMEEALGKLEKEGISGIVKMKEDYYIFKLDERRAVPRPPFGKIRSEIVRKLQYQKIAEILEKEVEALKKKISIEAYYDKL